MVCWEQREYMTYMRLWFSSHQFLWWRKNWKEANTQHGLGRRLGISTKCLVSRQNLRIPITRGGRFILLFIMCKGQQKISFKNLTVFMWLVILPQHLGDYLTGQIKQKFCQPSGTLFLSNLHVIERFQACLADVPGRQGKNKDPQFSRSLYSIGKDWPVNRQFQLISAMPK